MLWPEHLRPHHRRARSLQIRPLEPSCRNGALRGERVVFLLAEGSEVSERVTAESGGGNRVLEGDRSG
ncbi:hypothetical protein LINPERHAP1_LOCUS11704 [Linum perenne]